MAFYRCGSGGGTPTETLLWENPSPNATFAAQSVTLSDSISNYDYIHFYFKSGASTNNIRSNIYSVADVKASTKSGARNNVCSTACSNTGSASARSITYESDTQLAFSSAWSLGNAASYNQTTIPLSIYGIKGNLLP